jgi:hypothetical protein
MEQLREASDEYREAINRDPVFEPTYEVLTRCYGMFRGGEETRASSDGGHVPVQSFSASGTGSA